MPKRQNKICPSINVRGPRPEFSSRVRGHFEIHGQWACLNGRHEVYGVIRSYATKRLAEAFEVWHKIENGSTKNVLTLRLSTWVESKDVGKQYYAKAELWNVWIRNLLNMVGAIGSSCLFIGKSFPPRIDNSWETPYFSGQILHEVISVSHRNAPALARSMSHSIVRSTDGVATSDGRTTDNAPRLSIWCAMGPTRDNGKSWGARAAWQNGPRNWWTCGRFCMNQSMLREHGLIPLQVLKVLNYLTQLSVSSFVGIYRGDPP